jgi:hypothetical protein
MKIFRAATITIERKQNFILIIYKQEWMIWHETETPCQMWSSFMNSNQKFLVCFLLSRRCETMRKKMKTCWKIGTKFMKKSLKETFKIFSIYDELRINFIANLSETFNLLILCPRKQHLLHSKIYQFTKFICRRFN